MIRMSKRSQRNSVSLKLKPVGQVLVRRGAQFADNVYLGWKVKQSPKEVNLRVIT